MACNVSIADFKVRNTGIVNLLISLSPSNEFVLLAVFDLVIFVSGSSAEDCWKK